MIKIAITEMETPILLTTENRSLKMSKEAAVVSTTTPTLLMGKTTELSRPNRLNVSIKK